MRTCKECKNGLKRCEFSFKKYGSYYCDIECCLLENEDMPWRRSSDSCDKFSEKEKDNGKGKSN